MRQRVCDDDPFSSRAQLEEYVMRARGLSLIIAVQFAVIGCAGEDSDVRTPMSETGSGGRGTGGTVVVGSGGQVVSGTGGTVASGSGGAVAPGSGGTVVSGTGGTVVSGSGGTVASGSGGTVASGSGGSISTPSSTSSTIVPLYTYPGHVSWSAIISAKRAHPSVDVVAIVNPNNGPGSSLSSAYTSGISSLVSAGIRVIGYVYTQYGARDAAQVRADISRWHTWYPAVTGIFFDEESNVSGHETYYRDLSTYAKSLGMSFTVGNPGTDTRASYIGATDVTIIYESSGLPSLSSLGGWHTQHSRLNFAVIPYGVSLNTTWIQGARPLVGYIYLTNDTLPNPWDSLPSYFAALLTALE